MELNEGMFEMAYFYNEIKVFFEIFNYKNEYEPYVIWSFFYFNLF